MSHTVEDVARRVVAAVDSNVGYLLAAQWVVDRLTEIATRTRLRSMRQFGQVYIAAPITTSTATFTRDSPTVTFSVTATAALSPAIVGRHIRGAVSWYEIIGYQVISGIGTATLKAKYSEDTSTAGAYTIVQRWVALDPRASWIGKDFVHARRRIPIKRVSMQELDETFPSRPRVGFGADNCAEGPELPDGTKTVEFYPYSSTSESYFYVYWQEVPQYGLTDVLPKRIAPFILKEGALIDMFRYKAAQCANDNKENLAAYWRNESRAQETKWKEYIRDAIHADRGDDDTTFLLKHPGIQSLSFDITNARESVLSQWP